MPRLVYGQEYKLSRKDPSVGPVGIEPTTSGLKARCSAN